MLFNTTVTIPITQPEFPKFITQYNPAIETPYYKGLTGIYKPTSQEFTLFKDGDEISRCIIKDGQITLTASISLKALMEEYIRYVFFNDNRLFEWFAEQDHNQLTGIPIATRLIVESNYRPDLTGMRTYTAINELPQGITHPTSNTRIIRENNEFIILLDGYLVRMHIESESGVDTHYITQYALLKPTIETYQECYEIGQWLNAQSNN